MGIEPTLFAWEARVLPLNDTRDGRDCIAAFHKTPGLRGLKTKRRLLAPLIAQVKAGSDLLFAPRHNSHPKQAKHHHGR
jgi:hypothetical protein